MGASTANQPRTYEIGDRNDIPMGAVVLYEGVAVGIDSSTGLARSLTAGDAFVGFAIEKIDNSAGSAGGKYVHVYQKGRIELAIADAAITDIGKAVYASDDHTFTFTATSNSYVGRVVRFVSAGKVIVEFSVLIGGIITPLTDNSGGTAADTIAAIGGTYAQAEVRNAVASLSAKVNAILQALK